MNLSEHMAELARRAVPRTVTEHDQARLERAAAKRARKFQRLHHAKLRNLDGWPGPTPEQVAWAEESGESLLFAPPSPEERALLE